MERIMSETKKTKKSKAKKKTQKIEVPVEEVQAKTPEDSQEESPSSQEEISQEETLLKEEETISRDAYETLQKELEESRAKADENLEGWQRERAEFANYRKRIERERETLQQEITGTLVKKYLDVLDDLERALQNKPDDPWADGIELIYKKLQDILEPEGIQRIEAEGQPFDPNFHEAIAQTPSEEHESGAVIEVVRQGYILGEKVIRPALVRVAE